MTRDTCLTTKKRAIHTSHTVWVTHGTHWACEIASEIRRILLAVLLCVKVALNPLLVTNTNSTVG